MAWWNWFRKKSVPPVPIYFLRQGSNGSAVKQLQHCLNLAMARKRVKEDGVFGKETLLALEIFQVRSHLKIDGVYGPLTADALERRLKEKTKIKKIGT